MATENASAMELPSKLLRVSSKPMVMASRAAEPSELIKSTEPVTEGERSSGSSGAPSVLTEVMKD